MEGGNKNTSPLLTKYLDMYRKNPHSRVFAPLAETYRQLGMLKDAIRILREGIKRHPSYVLGHLCMARCYVDVDQYELAYATLRPLVGGHVDNVALQKLFADVCEHLSRDDEALDTYKQLLFLNPKDRDVAEKVKELESQLEKNYFDEALTGNSFPTEKLDPSVETFNDVDDWIQLSFVENKEAPLIATPVPEKVSDQRAPSVDDWTIHDQIEERIDREIEESEKDANPVITLTLVDLYCSQNYHDKALELLKKILELNPGDARTLQKMEDVRAMIEKKKVKAEGDDVLIRLVEEKVPPPKQRVNIEKIEEKFNLFLERLRERQRFYA